jgi:hypothetical protein
LRGRRLRARGRRDLIGGRRRRQGLRLDVVARVDLTTGRRTGLLHLRRRRVGLARDVRRRPRRFEGLPTELRHCSRRKARGNEDPKETGKESNHCERYTPRLRGGTRRRAATKMT